MSGLFDVSDKVALITGGRRGLGKAMALGLAEAGAQIAIVAASPEPGEIERDIAALGRPFLYLQADLRDRTQRASLVDRVVNHFGKIDVLVNNAGVQQRSEALTYPLSAWDQDIELLLTAVLDLSQQAAAHMVRQGSGKIVQIASISSFQGARGIVGYASAKHALVGLTKCLANEWASQGVNVNAIAPGFFETEMAADTLADQKKASELRGRVPAGRFGQPRDIVGPLIFLASEASRHVHGHTLLVDGGWMGR